MIRLLTAVLLLTYSLFGWASAYPDDYNNMVIFNDGDIIKAEDFNKNNNILKDSIDNIQAGPAGPQGEQGPAGPQGPAGADGIAAGLACTTDQIIKWDGSAWVCADMPSGGGEGIPSDGAAYGSPVWVDSSGTLLSGREGLSIIWRVNGELKTIGTVEDDAYRDRVRRYYSTDDCTGDQIGVRREGTELWVANGVLKGEGAFIENQQQYNSLSFYTGYCITESGDSADLNPNLKQEISTGVPAPSWTMDGTQIFRDLR